VARNRVTPFGSIEDLPGRGLLLGNRGVLHEQREVVRPYAHRAWIACVTEFKERRLPQWAPSHFTVLFFLDEATALAAGHRPCGECRREDHQHFRRLWGEAPLTDVDVTLHEERIEGRGRSAKKRRHEADGASLPDGSMIEVDGDSWLVLGDEVLRWTNDGYTDRGPRPAGSVTLLTPPSIVEVLRRGYEPLLHPSALTAAR
jgi:hypothetical protein